MHFIGTRFYISKQQCFFSFHFSSILELLFCPPVPLEICAIFYYVFFGVVKTDKLLKPSNTRIRVFYISSAYKNLFCLVNVKSRTKQSMFSYCFLLHTQVSLLYKTRQIEKAL